MTALAKQLKVGGSDGSILRPGALDDRGIAP
jgi:hypothetical protein